MKKKKKNYTESTKVLAHLIPKILEKENLEQDKKVVLGLTYQGTGKIEINPNQNSREYFDTLTHELLHCFFVDLNEKTVTILANKMTKVFWSKNFRRISK